jgi:hypothetical protein
VSALVFLVVAVALSVLGSLLVWLRNRAPRKTLTSGMTAFQREMAAMRPNARERRDVHTGREM